MVIKMILTNSFDPDPRVYKEAKTLVKNGHDVEIICWDREIRYPEKEVEVIDGIKIKRFYEKTSYGTGLKQIKGYVFFIKRVIKYLKDSNYDVVHAHDIDGAFAASFLKKESRKIWDMHEFYNGFNYNTVKKSIYEIIAKRCFRKIDGIVYAVPGQKEEYKSKINNRTHECLVLNTPESNIFKDYNPVYSDKLRISFIGKVREYNTLKMLMDVGETFSDVQININGDGVAYAELKKIEKNYKNTIITGKFTYKDVKKYYENSDMIYAVYDRSLHNVKFAFPVKGFEAIHLEIPVIANEGTYFGDFVINNGIGFTVKGDDEEELKRLIESILRDKSILNEKKKCIKKIKDLYTWEAQELNLLNLYKNIFQ